MVRQLVLGAALLIALALFPLFSPWSTVILTVALCEGLAALGIMVLLRAGQVSFGHGLFFSFSAYTVAFMAAAKLGHEALILIPVATAASGLLAAIVGLFIVRYRAIFFGMLNLAISMVFFSLLEKLFPITGGADGKRVPRPTLAGMEFGREQFELWIFYITLGLCLVAALFVARYLTSPGGKALEAIKSNETRLEYLGVSPRKVLFGAYLLSGLLAGLGGAVIALVSGHVTPELAYWVRSGEFVFIAILGGIGGVAGPFLGALMFQIIRGYAAVYAPETWHAVLGVMLLAIIFFAPAGLYGIATGSRRKEGGR
ncbi:branched-chain amino acid ABC transporter permease [Bosea sp. (in: a-proteobacteria)]|jgi:branched-chain amino acid transport system permease protein|uniref:branched-chain amino acid ABC transporter permease n=1 Tax=Bosea sp. (in: a-proteobacteria) TaxID=1871050 RepID=UPI001AC16C5F|nr:branched-chain amino acid ABC transporter permease [Bosea sp. (in: a-proteobacteria)]MBN9438144.1 branched-chain amino acid ABC transporter permease [Bosea sp. (in: a-proteobacteria)]MBN9449987.1 branched-chain amino acid ABC transporter permease [Bosea sp. (in: a-proteobacteria)]